MIYPLLNNRICFVTISDKLEVPSNIPDSEAETDTIEQLPSKMESKTRIKGKLIVRMYGFYLQVSMVFNNNMSRHGVIDN